MSVELGLSLCFFSIRSTLSALFNYIKDFRFIFFLETGFHRAHVLIGVAFLVALLLCLIAIITYVPVFTVIQATTRLKFNNLL